MTKLEQAARALLAKWDAHPYTPWREVGFISGDVAALREALAEQGCDYCNSDIFAGTKCNNCGRVAEQAEQEPVAWGRIFDGDIIDCICPEEHALNEGDYTIPLYAAPVRTKDLTDEDLCEIEQKCGYISHDNIRKIIALYEGKKNG